MVLSGGVVVITIAISTATYCATIIYNVMVAATAVIGSTTVNNMWLTRRAGSIMVMVMLTCTGADVYRRRKKLVFTICRR